MRIAVCLTGVPRFHEIGHDFMKHFYKGCQVDYYIHGWGTPHAKEALIKEFSPVEIVIDPFETFDEFLREVSFTNNSPNASNAISWLKSVYLVGKLLERSSKEYDLVIFTRTDIIAKGRNFLQILPELNLTAITSSFNHGSQWNIDSSNIQETGICGTLFLCSTKENMIYFSKLFEKVKEYISDNKIPLCHHRLIYTHMKELFKQYGHSQLWISDSSPNGGWFIVRDTNGTLQGI